MSQGEDLAGIRHGGGGELVVLWGAGVNTGRAGRAVPCLSCQIVAIVVCS